MQTDDETKNILEALPVSEVELDSSPWTNFAREDKMIRRNGKLYGNWENSFAGACGFTDFSHWIEEGSIISLEKIGACADGKIIIKAVHY
jgi:hypothetical protein